MSTKDYLAEFVLYGGVPTQRIDVERHLNELGVTGPARLVYARLPKIGSPHSPKIGPAAQRQNWTEV